MDELKRTLRAKANEMHIEPELPPELRRRSRHRRLVNATVTVAVIGAVGFGSFTGFRFALEQTSESRPVARADSNDESIPSLFPDPHLVPEIQRDAESGVAPGWLDARFVAERFAEEVMGWAQGGGRVQVLSDTPLRVAIWNPGVTVTRPIRTILSMQRYQGREDGILMVKMAASPDIEVVSPRPWDLIRPGQQVKVRGRRAFIQEGSRLRAVIGTVFGGTPTSRGHDEYAPEFAFEIQAPAERATVASFTLFDAEGTRVATTAFRLQGVALDSPEGPEVGPTPGPTPTSEDATPGAIPVELVNASTRADVPSYLDSLLENQGRGAHHGGYHVLTISESEGSEVTVISHSVGAVLEAERVSRLFFPDSELRPDAMQHPVAMRIVVGEDFAQRHADALDAFALVREFGSARSDPDRADRFLGPGAATYYHGDDDASLYGYAKGCEVEVWVAEDPEASEIAAGNLDEFHLSFCRRHTDSWTELIRVAPLNGELKVVEAFLAVVSEG